MTDKDMRWHAPLYERIDEWRRTKPSSFHVPGHKHGEMLALLDDIDHSVTETFQALMTMDVTELSVTDDLHDPTDAIAEAQRLAARCYGGDETFFLVGGSTAGNLAMLLACCNPGELIIVQRNAHKSVINGLALAGAQAVFLSPQREMQTGLDCVPSLFDVEEALKRYPQARAVMLTNPSYYGAYIDLTPYSALIHEHGKLLLVDEAHGAHYGHHPDFPRSAIQAGADAVVQSTHKTLPALTMGAMLHIQGDKINREAIRHSLTMIQSSSPSYPIMVSLDIARAMLDRLGASMFEQGVRRADSFRRWVASNEKLSFEVIDGSKHRIIERMDPLRIVLRDTTGCLSGYELQRQLEHRGCWVEMADPVYVVLLIGAAVSERDISRLQEALSEIARKCIFNEGIHASKDHYSSYSNACSDAYINEAIDLLSNYHEMESLAMDDQMERISEPILFSRSGVDGDSIEQVSVAEAAGRIAAEAVIPYPPGIPILYKGEWISAKAAAYIDKLAGYGARCQGAMDPTMRTIAVIRRS